MSSLQSYLLLHNFLQWCWSLSVRPLRNALRWVHACSPVTFYIQDADKSRSLVINQFFCFFFTPTDKNKLDRQVKKKKDIKNELILIERWKSTAADQRNICENFSIPHSTEQRLFSCISSFFPAFICDVKKKGKKKKKRERVVIVVNQQQQQTRCKCCSYIFENRPGLLSGVEIVRVYF